MSNSLLTIGKITNEALVVLENNLAFTKQVNRDYDDQFAQSGAKLVILSTCVNHPVPLVVVLLL